MDSSHLDQKYFVTNDTYNCPFCKRRHVAFTVAIPRSFNWSGNKTCYVWFVTCKSCEKTSMHLTYTTPREMADSIGNVWSFDKGVDLDSLFFYSVPTSFFALDSRIPEIFRNLIIEAEQCLKMNLLTGASACTRKAIYELTIREKAEGEDYESRIKYLKSKFPSVPEDYFDVLCHIKDMTSDKVHEQSWDKWDSTHLQLFLESLRAVLHEIYVVPEERKKGVSEVRKLLESVKNAKQPTAKKATESQ